MTRLWSTSGPTEPAPVPTPSNSATSSTVSPPASSPTAPRPDPKTTEPATDARQKRRESVAGSGQGEPGEELAAGADGGLLPLDDRRGVLPVGGAVLRLGDWPLALVDLGPVAV